MPPIRRLAFFINAQKSGAAELAEALMAAARTAAVELTQAERFPLPEGSLTGFDACCVIGGDGTLLGAVQFDITVIERPLMPWDLPNRKTGWPSSVYPQNGNPAQSHDGMSIRRRVTF